MLQLAEHLIKPYPQLGEVAGETDDLQGEEIDEADHSCDKQYHR